MLKKERTPRAGAADGRQRKRRRRRAPSWLNHPEFDALARSRCLMLLSVLSGEQSVTEAIAEAKIPRPTYYQLETKALNAMLLALNPRAAMTPEGLPDATAAGRIEKLERQVQRLEQEKRRSRRLLLLMRKSMRSPLMRPRRGRPPKNAPLASITSGKRRSGISKAKASPSADSTPTRAGESGAP
jgi:hypothetical protein